MIIIKEIEYTRLTDDTELIKRHFLQGGKLKRLSVFFME